MKKSILFVSIFLLFAKICLGQVLSEGITYDPDKKYYIITYCCSQDSSLHQGIYIPGHLVDPIIRVSVDLDSSVDLYKYTYRVENKTTAPRLLYSFSVKKHATIKSVKNPNSTWVNYFMPDSTISWRKSRARIKGIKPGNIETGFVLESFDPPSIIAILAASDTFTGFPDEGPSSAKIQRELASIEKKTEHIKLKSIGPRKLPEDISDVALLDTLQFYLTFSCDTTWIENQGICNSLEVKLENVREQLQSNNDKTAANNLQAFLNQLNALKEKQISSEAYALLYFNGKYLLEKLNN